MSQPPILECATLRVHPGSEAAFEAAIAQAFAFLPKAEGYLDHQLLRCIETEHQYLLLIHWTTVEAHMVNFRQSNHFVQWRALISPFFAEPPQVLHYQPRT